MIYFLFVIVGCIIDFLGTDFASSKADSHCLGKPLLDDDDRMYLVLDMILFIK